MTEGIGTASGRAGRDPFPSQIRAREKGEMAAWHERVSGKGHCPEYARWEPGRCCNRGSRLLLAGPGTGPQQVDRVLINLAPINASVSRAGRTEPLT